MIRNVITDVTKALGHLNLKLHLIKVYRLITIFAKGDNFYDVPYASQYYKSHPEWGQLLKERICS